MNQQGRYEIKFILTENELNEALNWLYCYSNTFLKYPPRTVNSLYFDNDRYQSIQDNLSGIPDRYKTRLRWYHNSREGMSVPVMEVKVKQGRLGYKNQFKLPELKNQLFDITFKEIASSIKTQLITQNDALDIFEDFIFPTLLVRYQRQYFESIDGVRVTIDSNISFNDPPSHKKLGETLNVAYPKKIMEIKFTPSQKDKVAGQLKNLHLNPKRHSKYLTGMAIFGRVNYL